LRPKSFLKMIVYILGILIIFCSCGQKSSKPQENQEKPPQSLTQIEQNIDSIIDILDKEGKVQESTETGKQQGQESKNTSSQGSSQSGGSSQDSQQSGGSGQSSSQSGGSSQGSTGGESSQSSKQTQPSTPTNWEQVDKIIKDTHKKWNEYQPEAVKIGISSEMTNSFDNTLNTLTNNIDGKSLISTLSNATDLYKYIPEFLSHYKSKFVDIKRVKYFTRDVMYNSRSDKWDLADNSITKMNTLLSNIRSQSSEEIKNNINSLLYGISDLEKVTKERQKNLIQIKGNIILDNIKIIEKYIEKQTQKEEQEQKK